MDCPHATESGKLLRCEILAANGISTIAGRGTKNYPCDTCKAQWTDGPPTPERLTPKLESLLALFSGELPEPQAIEKHIDTQEPRQPCYHLGRILNRLGCNCPQKWVRECRCEHTSGKTTLPQCQTCEHYEEA